MSALVMIACIVVVLHPSLAFETEPGPTAEVSIGEEPAAEAEAESTGSTAEADACPPAEQELEQQEEGPACHGVLTCSLYVVGKVLVLPFRLLQGAFDIII